MPGHENRRSQESDKKWFELARRLFQLAGYRQTNRRTLFQTVLGVLASGYKNAKQLAFMANAFKAIKDATEDGDSKKGVLPVGQVQGLIHDQPTVAELFERIMKEAKAAQAKVNAALD